MDELSFRRFLGDFGLDFRQREFQTESATQACFMSRFNLRLTFVIVSLASCLVCGCGQNGVRGILQQVGAKAVERSSEDELRKMIDSTNDLCPQRVDAFTTLKEVELIDDTNVEFRYVVNNAGKKFAARFDKRALREAMVEHMRGNAMAVAIAERDLSIQHIYHDELGGHVLSYTINRAVLAGDFDPLGAEKSNPFDVQTVQADAADIVADPALQEPAVEQPPAKKKPPMPRHFKGSKRSKENPAGVQSNPYFNET